jgi:CBS domain containing-hemolysin-like protein
MSVVLLVVVPLVVLVVLELVVCALAPKVVNITRHAQIAAITARILFSFLMVIFRAHNHKYS